MKVGFLVGRFSKFSDNLAKQFEFSSNTYQERASSRMRDTFETVLMKPILIIILLVNLWGIIRVEQELLLHLIVETRCISYSIICTISRFWRSIKHEFLSSILSSIRCSWTFFTFVLVMFIVSCCFETLYVT